MMLSVPVSLTSLQIIISTFFSVTGLGIVSYFFVVEKYSIVYMYPHRVSIHLKFLQLTCFPDVALASLAMIAGVYFTFFYFLWIYAHAWDSWVLNTSVFFFK